jgi:transforming growth factor-beta-induced protein
MKSFKTFNTAKIIMASALLLTISLATVMANSPAKATKSIVEIAVSNPDFSILVEALSKAELVDALSGDGPFTVFAPTNEAFENLFKEIGVSSVNDLTKDQLTPILLYHVVSGKVMASSVTSGSVETLNQDASLSVKKSRKGVVINKNSTVVATDIEASNGVIHVIDVILMPTDTKKTSNADSSSCN